LIHQVVKILPVTILYEWVKGHTIPVRIKSSNTLSTKKQIVKRGSFKRIKHRSAQVADHWHQQITKSVSFMTAQSSLQNSTQL